jgi:hypothetical protein
LIFLKNGMKNKLSFALKILGQIGIRWGDGVCLTERMSIAGKIKERGD